MEAEHRDFVIRYRLAQLVRIRDFCVTSNQARGIWKVIDEQRELLELLMRQEPDVLLRHPWIEGWLARTDMFLLSLVRLLGLPDSPQGVDGHFPRNWPGSYDRSNVREHSSVTATDNSAS